MFATNFSGNGRNGIGGIGDGRALATDDTKENLLLIHEEAMVKI